MIIEDIGKRLEEERQRLGIKAVDVYSELDIHQNTYKNYEMGRREMPSSLLVTLWNMGFDVIYILTGQRIGDIATDVINNGESYVPSYHQRLIHLPEIMDLDNPSDRLLGAMYHAEEALVQAGANANEDYDYKTLATLGLGLIDTVKRGNP
ncbi:helix-turn-helix domain-containing protein [Psychrobacter sp. UBA2514]|jgi:hypothetical protein|uniref:helix-turn-helix domain-containing protein n=1 Tax=Psychrobacter sp. UBA2514 TaxID=1947346 RepID=UPI00257A2B76|nr:helix-turn-helix transcriptional regulator [Psychrobacter sp. UBA2514]|tara:strand:- start:25704 stop:26156 length:453 start_codon:yes stop_codon:yes gene_type:complete